MGDGGDGDRQTIESICPACVARAQAFARPSMKMPGLVIRIIDEAGREPPKVTALLHRDGELRGIGVGADETTALLDAVAKHEAKLEEEGRQR